MHKRDRGLRCRSGKQVRWGSRGWQLSYCGREGHVISSSGGKGACCSKAAGPDRVSRGRRLQAQGNLLGPRYTSGH